ncbi:hypothetical protein KBB12_02620 [Candidatus Woesebacteria bacterium]|nr:hypothetical protein [Candidatus Woesebacteria bacterium]
MRSHKKDYKHEIQAYVGLVSAVKDIRDRLKNGKIELSHAQEELKTAESHFQSSFPSHVH